MKVLFDRNGLQAAVHLGCHTCPRAMTVKGKRLRTLLSTIEDLGCRTAFTDTNADEIGDAMLADSSVLVITTRMPRLPKNSEHELKTIRRFVEQGGGLLVMSNHPFPSMPNLIPDIHVASQFGVTLCDPIYPPPAQQRGLTEIYGNDLRKHAITEGLSGPIVFNNSCRISAIVGDVIATLPGEQSAPNGFAVAIEASENAKGRIVVTADSGFIADDDTGYPGPGLICRGDNKAFIRQVFEWLLKQR